MDGVPLAEGASGRGWSFRDGVLVLRGADGATFSGAATNGEVRLSAAASSRISVSNLVVSAPESGRCALEIAKGAELAFVAAGTNSFASGPDRAGIEVPPGAALRVFGGTAGAGGARAEVAARGGASAAGVGGHGGFGDGGGCGEVSVSGNVDLVSDGGSNGAGIGGGWGGSGGAVSARTGAGIVARGGWNAPGIGGGRDGEPGSLSVSLGRVEATGGASAPGISASVALDGGFVLATAGKGGSSTPDLKLPENDPRGLVVTAGTLSAVPERVSGHACAPDGTPLLPVSVPLGASPLDELAEAAGIDLSGAEKDEFGNVVVWLPPSVASLRIGNDVFQIRETPPPAGVTVNGADAATGGGPGWVWKDGEIALSGPGPFRLGGRCRDGRARVAAIAEKCTVVLDGLSIDASRTDFPAFRVAPGSEAGIVLRGTNTLSSGKGCAGLQVEAGAAATFRSAADSGILSGGAGALFAFGGRQGAGIGGGFRQGAGKIRIVSGEIHAAGGDEAAGIGGGSWGDGADFEMEGGYASAVAGMDAAGIGGGKFRPAGPFKMSGGTAVPVGAEGVAAVGGGRDAPKPSTGDVVITGGNLAVGPGKVFPAPFRDGRAYTTRAGKKFERTALRRAVADVGVPGAALAVSGLAGYGTRDIRSSPSGKLVFWLANGDHEFSLGDGRRFATHVGPDVAGQIEFRPATGISVDGVDAAAGGGFAWHWDGAAIEFGGAGPFVISGTGTTSLFVPGGNKTEIVFSNLVVRAPAGVPAFRFGPGARATAVLEGRNLLVGGDGAGAVETGGKSRLKIVRGRGRASLELAAGAGAAGAVATGPDGTPGEITTGRGVESTAPRAGETAASIRFEARP